MLAGSRTTRCGIMIERLHTNGIFFVKALWMADPSIARKHLLSQLKICDEDPDTALSKLKKVPFSEIVPVAREMLKVCVYIITIDQIAPVM